MSEYEYEYTKKRAMFKTFADGWETLKHFWIKKRVMVIDLTADYDEELHKEYYIRRSYWTDEKAAELHAKGYRICKNCPDHDNLAWIGVPVLIKLHGFKTFETDEKDNPMFLNDRMNNNLLNKFAKSLARAAIVGGMDLQKLILMGAIGVAAVIGMKFMGVF